MIYKLIFAKMNLCSIMKNFTLVVFVLTVSSLVGFSQSTEELEKRKGFKDLKVYTEVNEYDFLNLDKEVKGDIPNVAIYKPTKGKYTSIGAIKIHDMEIITYRDYIHEIIITTEKEPNLFKGLQKAFGKGKYDWRSDKFYWSATSLNLTFQSIAKAKTQLVYHSKEIDELIKTDKKSKVTDLVSEF